MHMQSGATSAWYMDYELTRMKYAMKKLTDEDAPYSALCSFGVVLL